MSDTFKLDVESPVLVTGATGYVAGWIIKKLLEEGVTIHAAVRDPSNAKKIAHLEKLKESSKGDIKYFKSDLLENGSYDEGMAGCKVVFHTASPFTFKIKDPQKDLVDPALLGTRNVLASVNKTPSVKRVVLTSSVASIYGDNKDLLDIPNQTINEENWNTTSSLTHQPYPYSKTVAEKAAWELNKKQDRWDLVTINPSFVMGPFLGSANTSQSFDFLVSIGDGQNKMGMPHIELGVVDVREVADAHVKAAFLPNAHGRYLLSGHDTTVLGIAGTLLPEYSKYPIPTRLIPKFVATIFGPLLDSSISRSFLRFNVGYPFKSDNSKSIKELGINYRPLKESVCEFFQQLIDNKLIKSL